MQNFNAVQQRDMIINWAKNNLSDYDEKPIVIGISGGKDSTITAAMLVEIFGKDRIFGVRLPNGNQHDIDIAREVCEYLGIQSVEIDIGNTYQMMLYDIRKKLKFGNFNQTVLTNAPCRVRTVMLYTIANQYHGRVANTCNLSESFVGYDTKFGDQCGDFGLFQDYTATEEKSIGYSLGLPEKFIEKAPDDGMCGQTDEDRWGFKYMYLDNWIRSGGNIITDTDKKIVEMHKNAMHKIKAITLPHPIYRPEGSHYLTEEL